MPLPAFVIPMLSAVAGGVAASASGSFFSGSPEVRENVSTLRPEQEELFNQLQNAAGRRGAGGAFGDSADYYRDLLSDNSADFNAFADPELRRYREQTIPGLSEQFAGMGAGGLSSSGFRNAQNQGAMDLTERLAALRANLRMQGAQGLQGIGQFGLNNFSNNMTTEEGTEGLLSSMAPAIGKGITYLGGKAIDSYFNSPAKQSAAMPQTSLNETSGKSAFI